MLGGVDPIIIFQFALAQPTVFGPQDSIVGRIPVIADIPTVVEQPPIPVYLSENLTGIFIDQESKSVDIETKTETLADGATPNVKQKGIQAGIEVNLLARKDSIGLTLLSALMDQVFEKVSSREYAITYIHGAITIFRGLLHNFSMDQDAGSELMRIKFSLSKGETEPTKPPGPPVTPRLTSAQALT